MRPIDIHRLCPNLSEHLQEGTIRITKRGEYVGVAADGVEVQFGMQGDERTIEKYLQSHNDPSQW